MNDSTSTHPTPLTRRWQIVSSPPVRERDEESRSCTDIRTARFWARAREKALDGGTVRSETPLVAVEWEDITAYSRTAIPEDCEPSRSPRSDRPGSGGGPCQRAERACGPVRAPFDGTRTGVFG